MNRTYTPELAPDVLDRLDLYSARFRDHFKPPKQAAYCGAFLQRAPPRRRTQEHRAHVPTGPLSRRDEGRRPRPGLQQFLGQSPCDDQTVMRTYRSTLAEAFTSPQGSLSSMTPDYPIRASTPSASVTSTAEPWASRLTVRSPPRSTTSAPGTHAPRCPAVSAQGVNRRHRAARARCR